MSQPRGFRQIVVLVGFAIFLSVFCRSTAANLIYVTTSFVVLLPLNKSKGAHESFDNFSLRF